MSALTPRGFVGGSSGRARFQEAVPAPFTRRISLAHVPYRMCHVCRRKFPKKELERYVCRVDGEGNKQLHMDPEQKMPGRGLYICRHRECKNSKRAFRGRLKTC